MRSAALTALFFALFALFSSVSYAAPVAPQGAITKRQACQANGGCRDAVTAPTTSSSDSTDSAADLMGQIFAVFYNNLISTSGASNTPNNPPAAAYASSGTSSAPTNGPTGV